MPKTTAFKKRSKGGRKAPRKTKSTIFWETQFIPLLKDMHGTHAQKIFHRLMKKSSTLRSTLKRRSKEYEVLFGISLIEVRKLILNAYGSTCKYCDNILTVKNMVCDHMIPLSSGGQSTPNNLEMICGRCNTRKGPLTTNEYDKVVQWLSQEKPWVRDYINRKLSGKELF